MTDFSKVNIKGLEENQDVDIRKRLGNYLYYNSKDLTGNELGRKIYFSEGEIELSEEEKKLVQNAADAIWGTYVMKTAIDNALK